MSDVKTFFDVENIRHYVNIIKKEIEKLELEGVSDSFDFELHIMETFPEFYQSNPFLVKKLCKRDDISILYRMLDNLDQVDKGNKSLASVELNLGQELADQYLGPVLNKNSK